MSINILLSIQNPKNPLIPRIQIQTKRTILTNPLLSHYRWNKRYT